VWVRITDDPVRLSVCRTMGERGVQSGVYRRYHCTAANPEQPPPYSYHLRAVLSG
jgi:hypothetical protein